MKYKLENGKEINIPEEEIKANMKGLNVSREEAVEIWLEDEGYEINKEQEELMQKTKGIRVNTGAKKDAPRAKRTVVQKEDCEKENIIETLYEAVSALEGVAATIENKTKIITFTLNGCEYKIDLVRKRTKNK